MIKYLDILIKKTSDQDPLVAYDESATTWRILVLARFLTRLSNPGQYDHSELNRDYQGWKRQKIGPDDKTNISTPTMSM